MTGSESVVSGGAKDHFRSMATITEVLGLGTHGGKVHQILYHINPFDYLLTCVSSSCSVYCECVKNIRSEMYLKTSLRAHL